MPHKIYVGNYPLSFIEDDILNLFQDYEGVELVGFFRNNNKCYSFLHCIDQSQLIEIITNLNDIDVCGRNLVVRAADENLHKQIQESISKNSASNFHPKNAHHPNNSSYGIKTDEAVSKNYSKQSKIPQMPTSESKNTSLKGQKNNSSTWHSNTPNTYHNSRGAPKQGVNISDKYEYPDNTPNTYSYNNSRGAPKQGVNISDKYEYPDYSPHLSENTPNTYSYNNSRGAPKQGVNSSDKYEYPDYSPHLSANTPNTYSYNNSGGASKQGENISYNYEDSDYSPDLCRSNRISRQNNHFPQTHCDAHQEKRANSICQNLNEFPEEKSVNINPQETFSKISKSKTESPASYKTMNERFNSYRKTNNMGDIEDTSNIKPPVTSKREQFQSRIRNISESSLETVHRAPNPEENEDLSFVSVMNFPLNLPVRELYKLFGDFHPLKVFIVCNKPRMDKKPTEAVICFENDKDATEAILTLDNTVFRGRILLVTDAVDESLISELLSFGNVKDKEKQDHYS